MSAVPPTPFIVGMDETGKNKFKDLPLFSYYRDPQRSAGTLTVEC